MQRATLANELLREGYGLSNDDLQFLQSFSEEEFSELVLIPLLEAMGYREIRYTHGPRELGKDIVFTRSDPIEGDITLAAVVKMVKMTGSVSSRSSTREIYHQVAQALRAPLTDPMTGAELKIVRAYIVTPFEASIESVESIKGELSRGENQVGILDGPRILDRIREHLPDLLDTIQTPEQRFLQSLMIRLASSRTSGPLSPTRTSSLLDLYTGGDLAPVTRETAALAGFTNPLELTARVSVTTVLEARKHIVVVADVGAGKTSLLQRIAIDYLQANIKGTSSAKLPLLVPLHRLPIDALHAGRLLPAIWDYLERGGLPIGMRSSSDLVLLLDGFDEIADPSITGKGLFEHLSTHFGASIITTRPSRIPEVTSTYSYFTLHPFSAKDIESFLRKWFSGDRELALAVNQKIEADSLLRIFCRTPLILTLFAILAERLPLEQLPARRTAIYSAIIELLLGRWDEVRGVRNVYPPDMKFFILERIAVQLHGRGERRMDLSLLMEEAKRSLKSAGARGLGGSEWILTRELFYRSSLLRGSGDAYMEFTHLSFQEFFAASSLARSFNQEQLIRTIYDEWWRGVWTFFFGLRRTLDDVKLPRQSRIRRAPALRAFLAEADFTSDAKRREVIEIIAAEVLRQPRLDQPTAQYYASFGLELVNALAADVEAARSESTINLFNFALLAILVGDDESLDLVRRSKVVIRRVDVAEILVLLRLLSQRLASFYGRSLFRALCERLAQASGVSAETRASARGALIAISRELKDLRSHEHFERSDYVEVQTLLFDTVKALGAKPGGRMFDPDTLSHWPK
jgi:hypothetical protein